ncbi:hypothetical protein BG004_008027 [Podila humilis]|nr:hypothetical protein BG004_008027 [Podila humilis]
MHNSSLYKNQEQMRRWLTTVSQHCILIFKNLTVKILDKEARTRQLRHHLDSLERDNFVALNEYEAIIATAAAAASAPGPISLTTTKIGPLGLLPPLSPAVGSLVGGIAGTIGPGAATSGGGPIVGGRSKKSAAANATGAYNTPSSYAALGHRKPILPRKPLSQLLDESGLTRQDPSIVSYCTAAIGPNLYKKLGFYSSNRLIMPFPRLSTHGRFVENLRLAGLPPAVIVELVLQLPNLRSLELIERTFSYQELELILASVQTPLVHFRISLSPPLHYPPEQVWYHNPIILTAAALSNLQSLELTALRMTLHVDDLLYILKSCPHLRSLSLVFLRVVHWEVDVFAIESGSSLNARGEFDAPGKVRFPISSTQTEVLYGGRRLRTLKVDYCRISDHALLRLLGIDIIPPTDSVALPEHALVHLNAEVNSNYRLTVKSVSRILSECSRLRCLGLHDAKVGTPALFQKEQIWACANTLQEVSLSLKSYQISKRNDYFGPMSAENGIVILSSAEEQLVQDRLSSLTQLSTLVFYAVVSFEMLNVLDMSFAKHLRSAWIEFMLRVKDQKRTAEACAGWVRRQPTGWSSRIAGASCKLLFEKPGTKAKPRMS